MKKDEKLKYEPYPERVWTIEDLRKKLEKDRLKYTHGIKPDPIRRAMMVMSDNQNKMKATKET